MVDLALFSGGCVPNGRLVGRPFAPLPARDLGAVVSEIVVSRAYGFVARRCPLFEYRGGGTPRVLRDDEKMAWTVFRIQSNA